MRFHTCLRIPPQRLVAATVVVGLLAWISPQCVSADEAVDSLRPLLRTYCFECHGAEMQESDLDFSRVTGAGSLEEDGEFWSRVLEQVQSHVMPPEDSPGPTAEERDRMVEVLAGLLDRLAEQAPHDPGRVTMRRLNRRQYNHTIRDLLGIDLEPASNFPADDVRDGFDNNGDALTLPPILLEKYLTAADLALDQAIVSDGPPRTVQINLEGEWLRAAARGRAKSKETSSEPSDSFPESGDAVTLGLEEEITCQLEDPPSGHYRVRFRASLAGASPQPATVALWLDGVDLALLRVDRREFQEYEATLPVSSGARRLLLRHTPATANQPKKDSPPPPELRIQRLEVIGPARALSHRRLFFVEPGDEGLSDIEAARAVLERFASRAFRRPATKEQLERPLAIYRQGREEGLSFVQALRTPLWSILVSPHFLFLVETERPSGIDGNYTLDQYEIASRLSYFLWSSMPDERLFQLAEQQRLSDPDMLVAEVDRMLEDPRSSDLVDSFVSQWLGLERLERAERNAEQYREFDERLRREMRAEPLMLFEYILREDRSLMELLTADYAFLNHRLARLYGLEIEGGDTLRRVPLPDARRGGVITTAAVLTATSLPTRTSPVNRGKWILEQILGAPPPPPPPDVPELEQQAAESAEGRPLSLRERLEAHRADPQCAPCHRRMDVLGLGLENYDALGRWREQVGGQEIDASGTLPGGDSFADPAGLKRILSAQRDAFTRTLTEKLLSYASGRSITRSDHREITSIVQTVASDGYRLRRLIHEVVRSDAFRMRRAAAIDERPTTDNNSGETQ